MLYLLCRLNGKINFQLASNIEGFAAFGEIFFEYKDQENKSRIALVQAKHYNVHRPLKNITFEDLLMEMIESNRKKILG
ncbi:hypothetical protein IHO40_00975 [Wolbachia endosymbiont of Mansonella ozzardi]|uniref:hypothetical protein n=1 Tax=Wolbachia endosymbiont of Mansonella ozzardi TaxID=137464 RepID=UPI001CE07410|nr:hypothetical protein [Wolbachia endosymbiont of Mansonella ozzardi]MCA4774747.1 hypothetical protein [Wolbachia endosymbiont of Mansonella ozzardi]